MRHPFIMMMAIAAITAGCGADDSSDGSYVDYGYDDNNADFYQSANNATNNTYAPGDEADINFAEPIDPTTTENYEAQTENDFIETATESTSTFSSDVDTASYTLMRRDILDGRLPNQDGVRVEEYINFFDYDYPEPSDDKPFSINVEIAPSEFGDGLHMFRVGLKGRTIAKEDMRPVNLVFLVDVSGSMSQEMPLVRYSLNQLANNLRPGDQIGIVTYASNPGVLLQPTDVTDLDTIVQGINGLSSGGSTNGEGGIVSAYNLAEQSAIEDGINRVVIVTDGDFNVGRTGQALRDLVEEKRELHIGLTVAGVGVGNFNDADLEAFARTSNGNYFYIDGEAEADRVFGTDVVSTLEVIAADVKVQVEFDPEAVVRYRLVGYENRLLDNQDFMDDTKDAGEIGPGHTVTALYELELAEDATPASGFIAQVRLNHKAQFGDVSETQTQNIKPSQVKATLADASLDLQFAEAVVEYAEILRGSMHTDGMRLDDIATLASGAAGDAADRLEFLDLLDRSTDLLAP